MVFHRERELEKTAVPFLKSMRLQYAWRVPIHNRVIDLAAVDPSGSVIGIEFKLSDWRRAIEQAHRNLNALDFVYVCLPGGTYLTRLKASASELGIGVMVYDEVASSVRIELPAKRITSQWEPNVKYLRDYVMARGSK